MRRTVYTIQAYEKGSEDSYIVGVYDRYALADRAARIQEEHTRNKVQCVILAWKVNDGIQGRTEFQPELIRGRPQLEPPVPDRTLVTAKQRDNLFYFRDILWEKCKGKVTLKESRMLGKWRSIADMCYGEPWFRDQGLIATNDMGKFKFTMEDGSDPMDGLFGDPTLDKPWGSHKADGTIGIERADWDIIGHRIDWLIENVRMK